MSGGTEIGLPRPEEASDWLLTEVTPKLWVPRGLRTRKYLRGEGIETLGSPCHDITHHYRKILKVYDAV